MERSETCAVSSAPEPGEVSPFERLCREYIVTWLCIDQNRRVEIVARSEGAFDEEAAEIAQPLTTTSGDPIPFDTALQLAASFLLARLGGTDER